MIKQIKYLKPFLPQITISLALLVLKSLSDLYLPTLTATIVNKGIVNNDIPYILQIGGIMLAIAAFGVICNLIAIYISAKAGNGFCKVLRDKVFTNVENFSLNEFNKFGTASLITRTTNDITQIRIIMDFGLRMIVMSPILCIGSVILAFLKDPTLALIFVVAIPVISLIFYFFLQKGLPIFAAMQTKLDQINLILREGLTGIRVIRAFNRDAAEKLRFTEANRDYCDTSILVNRMMGIMMPLVTFVMNIAIIAIVWFGGIRISTGNIQVGDLMAFIQYAMLITSSLVTLTRLFIMIPRATASADRISEVIETIPEIRDPEAEKAASGERGNVEFKNVSFYYQGAEQPVLKNISFSAKPGKTTAIIGGTGSGKSTLISLLLRLYDVSGGSILVDGVDIREMAQSSLRNKIGYVPQKAVLFSGPVRENIAFGDQNSKAEDIEHAADIAQASEFIENMKDGLETKIAQGGKNVSGGQKQRIAIARAIIRKPEIYIFDDSFSALDYKTDALLRRALKKETTQSTVIIISQRVSTIMEADQIIVLENGEIEGMGTHEELLSSCTVYKEIVATQLSEEVSA